MSTKLADFMVSTKLADSSMLRHAVCSLAFGLHGVTAIDPATLVET